MRIPSHILGLAVVGFLAGPNQASAQESELDLAVGDTVEFAIDLEDFFGAWIGTVHEVRNPRGCVFVVHDKILKGDVFSMGIRFSDDFELQTHSSSEGTRTITALTLKEHGIDCVETHPTPHPDYLHPEDEAREPSKRSWLTRNRFMAGPLWTE